MRTFRECLEDPEEQPFIVALLNDYSDGPRHNYAEWLEKRGDPRGEAVRIANQLLAGVEGSAERNRLSARLSALSGLFDEMLRPLLLHPGPVNNCGTAMAEEPAVRFAFRCEQSWGQMRPTADEKVRFCESCATAVVRCDSMAEAERQALLGACISVDARIVDQASDKYCGHVTGRPDVFASWARHLFVAR